MGESRTTRAEERTAKITIGEKLGYGIGDAGFNFYWVLIGSYLSYFYTDVFGLTPAVAGSMFLITKIIDAFTDPAMGAIADRTHTRFGKFRPYLLFGSLPMAAAAILTMTTPDLDGAGKIIWAYATYSAMMLCYTILSTPYSSLSGVLTADTMERNQIFGIRFFFAYFVGIFVGAATPGLAKYLGGGDDAAGWQLTMVLYSVVASCLFLISFFTTRERIQPPPQQKTQVKRDIADLLSNKPWLILFALAMIIMITLTMRNGSASYYFKYFLERPDLMGVYIGLQNLCYMLGALITPWLTRYIGKAKLLIYLMGIVGVLSILFAFVPKPDSNGIITVAEKGEHTIRAEDLLGMTNQEGDVFEWSSHKKVYWIITRKVVLDETSAELHLPEGKEEVISVKKKSKDGTVSDSADTPGVIYLVFVLNILISFVLGPKAPLTWSMYADAADYNEWKTGRRATAMTFSAATFSQKLGGALASAGMLYVLGYMNYVANEAQSGSSLLGIVLIHTVIPGIFAFVSIIALRYYYLDENLLGKVQIDLKSRQAAVDG